MANFSYLTEYNIDVFLKESEDLITGLKSCRKIERARDLLIERTAKTFRTLSTNADLPAHKLIRMRDCCQALTAVFSNRSENLTGFSVLQALCDISRGRTRPDIEPGFFAELIQWIRGLEGRAEFKFPCCYSDNGEVSGREKAIERSRYLDRLWEIVDSNLSSYANGLTQTSRSVREKRKKRILDSLHAATSDWDDWNWQIRNIIKDAEDIRRLTSVDKKQTDIIERALKGRLPFGITPYYVSLMDDQPNKNDYAIRAQVFPPDNYVNRMLAHRNEKSHSFDFMMESDTSPIDRITRRYPNIAILKPVSTCPQICVYCQRNWEIEQVMAPGSFASDSELNSAVDWIKVHPAIKEVLITGGDPLILSDKKIETLLKKVALIEHVDIIRIGTRTPVTLPMRITDALAEILGQFREPGIRDIAVMTHIEHPYEITHDTAIVVDKLKRRGISVYNQQVYTFYVSKRFESTLLRILLRRIGIDPYYTFMPKGKKETDAYRVPLARILQEQKEEARLVPGLRRTDEAVFNVPGLGKNYLKAMQHRDLITVLPDGKRIYEFHPWEMNLADCHTYLYTDVAIYDYLRRLQKIDENPENYDSIWYFF